MAIDAGTNIYLTSIYFCVNIDDFVNTDLTLVSTGLAVVGISAVLVISFAGNVTVIVNS
jgi:hypothetical protein